MKLHGFRVAFVIVLMTAVAVISTGSFAQSSQKAAGAKPAMGIPFSLIDHHGKAVSDKDFAGNYMLVYFGYTFCPDVCPTGLTIIGAVMDTLGKAGNAMAPIFISVDPDRDTVKILADYVENFHSRLIGLTGTSEQIAAAAKIYGARYFKVFDMPGADDDAAEESEEDENMNYSVNHSADTYLVGPKGRVLAVFPYGMPAEDMVAGIRKFIAGPS